MKILCVWLLSMVLGCGAETVAWKVSLERVVEGGVKSPKLTRLEVPPAESVFFEEGDELWDLMGAITIERWVPDDPSKRGKGDPGERKRGQFAGDWLVWNARSKKVVGRGSWDGLEEIDDLLVYEQIRSMVVIEKNGQVEGSVVTVCGSGERAEKIEGKLMAKVAPNSSWDGESIDLNYEVKIDKGDGRVTEIKSGASIPLKKGASLAGWRENGDYYDLSVTFDLVSKDGGLMKAVRQREAEGKAVRLKILGIDYWRYDGVTLKNGLEVGVFRLAPDYSCRVVQEHPRSEVDFPPEMEGLSSGVYEEVSEKLEAIGVNFESVGAFAVMNYSSSILIAVNDRVNLGKIEALVERDHVGHYPAQVRCHVEWGDQTRKLLVRSGEMGSIRQVRGEVIEKELKLAPNVAADNRGVELWLSLNVPGQGVALDSSATLIDGVPLLVGEFGKEGEALGVTINCSVISDEP